MLEALQHTERTGDRVRPVVWSQTKPNQWVINRVVGDTQFFLKVNDNNHNYSTLWLSTRDELVGPWEVFA